MEGHRPRFEYEVVHGAYDTYYKWTLVLENGYCIKGQANSIRQAYRLARKAFKRYRKMNRLLEGHHGESL